MAPKQIHKSFESLEARRTQGASAIKPKLQSGNARGFVGLDARLHLRIGAEQLETRDHFTGHKRRSALAISYKPAGLNLPGNSFKAGAVEGTAVEVRLPRAHGAQGEGHPGAALGQKGLEIVSEAHPGRYAAIQRPQTPSRLPGPGLKVSRKEKRGKFALANASIARATASPQTDFQNYFLQTGAAPCSTPLRNRPSPVSFGGSPCLDRSGRCA
jgi:hypothetical protein